MSRDEDQRETSRDPVGLIAGNGKFPYLVLAEARRRAVPVVTIAIRGETDPGIEDLSGQETSGAFHWVSLGQLSLAVRLLKKAGVSRAVMAGQVKHKQIFRALRPDPLLLRVLARASTRNTDAILSAVAEILEEEGIQLMDSTTFLASLLASAGSLSKRAPNREERGNIDFGFQMARELARLDIGQTVVVKAKAVVAAEAMEGTDETILRAGAIASSSPGALTVVKVARPLQDMRFDVPVIGIRTIDVMVSAGASALAVEAGKTLLLDRDELIERANGAAISVFGVEGVSDDKR